MTRAAPVLLALAAAEVQQLVEVFEEQRQARSAATRVPRRASVASDVGRRRPNAEPHARSHRRQAGQRGEARGWVLVKYATERGDDVDAARLEDAPAGPFRGVG